MSDDQKTYLRNVFNGVPNSPIVQIPDVTPRQIRQALILSGVALQDITNAINQMPEPNRSLAMVEWEYSVAFIRSNPLVAQVAAVVGWTPQQLDDLWVLARSL
jgi:hypothetical protein